MIPKTATLALFLLVSAATAQFSPIHLQKDINRCADKVLPATVRIEAADMDPTFRKRRGRLTASTGVIVHASGLVLSDASSTLQNSVRDRKTGKVTTTYGTKATIFLPPYKNYPARRFSARLIKRDEDSDTSLLQMDLPSSTRLPYLRIGDPKDFLPGAYLMVAGNSFGTASDGKPSVTLGLFSGWLMDPDNQGRFLTNAAVNPGNNGGPVTDLAGNLLGVVSTFGRNPEESIYGMGLITHIEMLAPVYNELPEGRKLFGGGRPWKQPRVAALLGRANHLLRKRVGRAVVGLEIDRGDAKNEIIYRVRDPRRRRIVNVRFKLCNGPFSGLCVDPKGYIVTSLKNLWKRDKIEMITVYVPDGREMDGKLVAIDHIRGIGLIKVDTDGEDLPVLPVAKGTPEPGSLALAVARPWDGEDLKENGLIMTNGLISCLHQGNKSMDAIQCDAGINDSMIGGALVNLQGELLGMTHLIDPDKTGRNSGIGFAVPGHAIKEAVRRLKGGKDVKPGFCGIRIMDRKDGSMEFTAITKDSPAAIGGLKKGDVLVSCDGRAAADYAMGRRVLNRLQAFAVGDKVEFVVKRDGSTKRITVTLGVRP